MTANSAIFEARKVARATAESAPFPPGKGGGFGFDFPRNLTLRNSPLNRPNSEAEKVEKTDAQVLRFERLRAARRLMPNERVAKCNWQKIAPYFEVWKSKTNKPARFRKIFICGSRAMCPVCAAKITERCKNELIAAFNVGHVHQVHEFMITFTLEHHKAEKFESVLNDLVESIRYLRGSQFWRDREKEYEIFGSVTSLENTYGLSNGFHPHKHIIFFSRRKLTDTDYQTLHDEITDAYKKILLKKYNRSLSRKNGVHVRGASQEVMEYVAKYGHEPRKIWNLATEMTKAEQKTGYKAGERYTPFQLLDENNLGDVDAGKAFQKYARAMKGKAFLTWSNGLRDLFGLGVELTDEEISAMDDERESFPYALGDGVAWRKVREMPDEVLDAARKMDVQSFREFMSDRGVFLELGETADGFPVEKVLENIRQEVIRVLENKRRKTKVPPDVLESMRAMDIQTLNETAKKFMKGKKRVRNIPPDVFESMMSLDFPTFRAAVKALPKLRVISDEKILPDLTLNEILENVKNNKAKLKGKARSR